MTGIKQSIFDQTGNFSFSVDLIISDLTKNVDFGFTGNSNVNFHLYQGKIYDNQNAYCGSYLANQDVFISGNIGSSTYEYFINGEIAAIGRAKNTGVINYFYLISDSGNTISCTTDIAGTLPQYSITNNPYFTTGSFCTGYIQNNEPLASFRIFSGSCDNTNITYTGNTTGNIPAGSSGYFLSWVSGAAVSSQYSGNYTFYTNFGEITVPITLNSYANNSTSPVVTSFNINTGNFVSISGPTGQFSYALGGLGIITTSGANYVPAPFINISLDYVSGFTGNITGSIYISQNVTLPVSGIVVGGQYTTGYATYNYSGNDVIGNPFTQTLSGVISQYIYYTGLVTDYFNTLCSGLASGLTVTQVYATGSGFLYSSGLASGYGNVPYSGNIAASGYNSSGNLVTGFISATQNNYIYATGINVVPVSVLGFGSGSGYQNTYINNTGYGSGFFQGYITGSGFITGFATGNVSGIPNGLLVPYLVYGTGGTTGYYPTGFTGYYFTNYTGAGNGVFSGIYNTGLGNITGSFSQNCTITGSVSGIISGANGTLVILNPTGFYTGTSYQYSFATGRTVYTSPTGYIYYNSFASGEGITFGPYSLTYDSNFYSFTGLLGQINSRNDFYNGTGYSPYLQAVDLGDHNTIQLTFTPNPTGNLNYTNYYLVNFPQYTGSYPYVYGTSGTTVALRYSGGSIYTPSGTFNFYPSGNFTIIDRVIMTGSAFISGIGYAPFYTSGNINATGIWGASGNFNQTYTGVITSSNYGSVTINQNFTGIPVAASGITGSALTPLGQFTGNLQESLSATGFNYQVISGTYNGYVPFYTTAVYAAYGYVTGIITGLASSNGYLLNQNIGITGIPTTGSITSSAYYGGYVLTGIGNFTGVNNDYTLGSGYNYNVISGILTGVANNCVIYQKNFLNTWMLYTGNDINSLNSFSGLGNSTGYFNSGIQNYSGNGLFVRIGYFPYSGGDMANLFISGIYTGLNILISGGIV